MFPWEQKEDKKDTVSEFLRNNKKYDHEKQSQRNDQNSQKYKNQQNNEINIQDDEINPFYDKRNKEVNQRDYEKFQKEERIKENQKRQAVIDQDIINLKKQQEKERKQILKQKQDKFTNDKNSFFLGGGEKQNKSRHSSVSPQYEYRKQHVYNYNYEGISNQDIFGNQSQVGRNKVMKDGRNYAQILKEQIEENERLKKIKKQQQIKDEQKANQKYLQSNYYGKRNGGGTSIDQENRSYITKLKEVQFDNNIGQVETEQNLKTKSFKNLQQYQQNFEKDDQNYKDIHEYNHIDLNDNDINQQQYKNENKDSFKYEKQSVYKEREIKNQPDLKKSMIYELTEKDQMEKQQNLVKKQQYYQEIQKQIEEKKRQEMEKKQKEYYEAMKEEERIQNELKEIAEKYQQEQENNKQREIQSNASKIQISRQMSEISKKKLKEKEFLEETQNNDTLISRKNSETDYEKIQSKIQQEKHEGNQLDQKKQKKLEQQQNQVNYYNNSTENEHFQDLYKSQQQNENGIQQENQQYFNPQNYQQSQFSTFENNNNRQIQVQQNGSDIYQFYQKIEYQDKLAKQKNQIDQITEQLQNQTSLLQNEMRELRKNALLAQERRRIAFQDLENLKQELQRQEIQEQMRANEIYNKRQMLQFQHQQPYNNLLKLHLYSNQLNNDHTNQYQFNKNNNNNSIGNFNNTLNNIIPNMNKSFSHQNLLNFYNNLHHQTYQPQQDILDSLLNNNNSSNNNFRNNQSMSQLQKPSNLNYKIESKLSSTGNASITDNNLQMIENLLLSVKNN